MQRLPRLGRGIGAYPDFVGELLGALDFSWFGLTLDFQLSTFNRVSFLFPSSPHLCALCVLCGENSSSFRSSLIPRHSPLTTNSFIIRTSKTPLPQLLYNPHLRAPLGSAGNKGLITPLESALTKNSPASRLESALTKRWGGGGKGGLADGAQGISCPRISVTVNFQLSIEDPGLVGAVNGLRGATNGGGRPAPQRCPCAEAHRGNTSYEERPTLRCLPEFPFSAK